MSHLVPLVNEFDEVIGFKQRDEITPTDINRATGLWITNSKKEILLARRSLTKRFSPNRWGPAAAGTLEKDESYLENIIKEMQEELGLGNITPLPVKKLLMSGYHPHFTQWFSCVIDKPCNSFTIQTEEVSEIRWFTPEEVLKMLKDQPELFVTNVFDWISLFLSV
jgi:isopentenyldiphosphate isomerase